MTGWGHSQKKSKFLEDQFLFDWYRLKRYLGDMADHITWKRLINLLLVEYEWRLNKTILKGLPYQLIIDPNNICQIKCPLCFTGMGNLGRPKGQMEFALFKNPPWALFIFSIISHQFPL